MRATIYRIAICIFILVAALCVISCSNDPSSWYPSGKATIISSYELLDSGYKSCVIALKIVNTGTSTINSYVVSLAAATDIRTYYKTTSADLVIPPGKSAYKDVQITYAVTTEILKADGLSIADEYYR